MGHYYDEKVTIINNYIQQLDEIILAKDSDRAEKLEDEIIAVFSTEIDHITRQLSSYSYGDKVDYVEDAKILKAKLTNYRINLTTYHKTNPKVAPNFCMVLRKHLIGLHIKNIITNDLEGIITIEFETLKESFVSLWRYFDPRNSTMPSLSFTILCRSSQSSLKAAPQTCQPRAIAISANADPTPPDVDLCRTSLLVFHAAKNL